MRAADIQPVDSVAQNQSTLDLFLIFVGANVVATTFQVGASLASSFTVTSGRPAWARRWSRSRTTARDHFAACRVAG